MEDLQDPAVSTRAVVEATYVNDEALYLPTSSPAQMAAAITTLLSLITATFGRYGFKLNWTKGKSECMLQLCGKKRSEGLLNSGGGDG